MDTLTLSELEILYRAAYMDCRGDYFLLTGNEAYKPDEESDGIVRLIRRKIALLDKLYSIIKARYGEVHAERMYKIPDEWKNLKTYSAENG